MSENPIDKAVRLVGGQSALAAALGVSQQRVWNWQHHDKQVAGNCVLAIERATGGRITRHELRPDLYPPEIGLRKHAQRKTASSGLRPDTDPWDDWEAENDAAEAVIVTLSACLVLCLAAFAILVGLLAGAGPVFALGAALYPFALCLLHRKARCET